MWEAIAFVFTGGILVLSGTLLGFGLARASNPKPKPEPLKYEIIAESMKRHSAGKGRSQVREDKSFTDEQLIRSQVMANTIKAQDDVQVVKDMLYADDGTTPTRAIPKQK